MKSIYFVSGLNSINLILGENDEKLYKNKLTKLANSIIDIVDSFNKKFEGKTYIVNSAGDVKSAPSKDYTEGAILASSYKVANNYYLFFDSQLIKLITNLIEYLNDDELNKILEKVITKIGEPKSIEISNINSITLPKILLNGRKLANFNLFKKGTYKLSLLHDNLDESQYLIYFNGSELKGDIELEKSSSILIMSKDSSNINVNDSKFVLSLKTYLIEVI